MELDDPIVNKKLKQSNFGDNILQKIDPTTTVADFVDDFYKSLISDPQSIIESGVITGYTQLKYEDIVYQGQTLLEILNHIRTAISQYKQYEQLRFIEKGSRTINIIVQFPRDLSEKIYIQEFTIVFNKIWYIQSSIFMII